MPPAPQVAGASAMQTPNAEPSPSPGGQGLTPLTPAGGSEEPPAACWCPQKVTRSCSGRTPRSPGEAGKESGGGTGWARVELLSGHSVWGRVYTEQRGQRGARHGL